MTHSGLGRGSQTAHIKTLLLQKTLGLRVFTHPRTRCFKIFAFQDRHEDKDAYDLIFTLLNHEIDRAPQDLRLRTARSPTTNRFQEALTRLAERFAVPGNDGPSAYALFLADPEDDEARARLQQEAVATVRQFFDGFGSAG